MEPNTIRMWDNGENGDKNFGDNAWTLIVELDEGELLYMPTTLPGLSIGKAQELLQQTDRLIATVPEVERVFGKVGRAETATDPAPLTMIETTIRLKPRAQWREGMTMEKLQKLPPAFVPKTGTVTAGNSSGLNDGSAAMLIMSADKARELGLTPLARIKAVGMGACHPSVMGLSPVPAVRNLLQRSGLKLEDFELIEVNEAFAAQYLGCEIELDLNREITNVNGSGIGLGHPVGATGARIMVTLLHAMQKRGNTLGLATLCGGGGVSLACAQPTA